MDERTPISRGYLVIGCRRHTVHGTNVARAILLDSVCLKAARGAPVEVWSYDQSKFTIRRQTSNGGGTGYDFRLKKHVTFFDDEPRTDSTEQHIIAIAQNLDSLILERELPENLLPIWLSPRTFSPVLRFLVRVEMVARSVAEAPDYIAEITYRRQLCVDAIDGDQFFEQWMRLAVSLSIPEGACLPVQWRSGNFGVLKILRFAGREADASLFVLEGSCEVAQGSALYRESGWSLGTKNVTYRADIARVLSVSSHPT